MSRPQRSRQPYQIKGVEALFEDSSSSLSNPENLSLEQIKLPKQQPRRYFDTQAMDDLIESVKKHGLLQPLLVRPLEENYELVAGERRYRAAKEAGLTEIPVVVRHLDQNEAFQLALIENLQREDLNPIEETEGILQLLAWNLNQSEEFVISLLNQAAHPERESVDNVIHTEDWKIILKVFASVGKLTPESFRTNRLPLLKLPTEIKEALRRGQIAYTKARAIAQLPDANQRKILLTEAVEQNLSLAEVREQVKASKPNQPKEDLLSRFDLTSKRLKKTKILLTDPKKRKKLESLLSQLEKLVGEESQ